MIPRTLSNGGIGRFARSVFLLAMLAPTLASAQTTYTWTGGGSDNNWNTAANWTPGAVGSGNGTVLVFSGSTRTSPNNTSPDWNFNLGRLEFAAGAASFTLTGNAVGFHRYLDNQKQEIFQNSANTQTIGWNMFSFQPGTDSQINLNAGDLVISSGNIYIDSDGSNIRSLYVTGIDTTRRTVTLAGQLNKNGGADPDIYIQNNKRLLVTGSITTGSGNDGSIFIDSGVLEFGSTGAMTGGAPVVGATSGSGTAAVYLNSAGSTFARQVEIRGGSSGPRIVGGLNTSGTATFSGNFVATNSPADYDLKAATGGTVVVSGQRNVAGTLQVNRADGATTFGGTVEISSTATGGSTTTVVNAGTLRVRDLVGDGWGVLRGSVTVNAGAQLDLVGESAALGYQSGGRVTSLSLAAGSVLNANTQHVWLAGGTVSLTAATVQTNGGVSSGTGEYFEWGASPVATVASSGTSTIAGRMNLRGDALSGRILTFTVADGAAATDLLVSAAITEGAGGFGNAGIAKYGAGTMKLTGANTYTGSTSLAGGTLGAGSAGALGSGGTISFNGGTLQYTGSNTTDYSGRFSTAAGQNFSIDTNGNSVTFASALTSSGGSLTKLGSGSLVLTANNTLSGTSTISQGTLQVGNGAAAVNISGPRAIAAGARLLISNTAYSNVGWSTITGAGTLELDGGSTYGNWGTVALPSGFTGTLQVDNAGRFDVSGTSALGNASAVTIQSGAQMLVTSANQTFSQAFSIAGFGSETNWNHGALRTYGNGTVFAGPITLTGNSGLMTQNHVGNSSLTVSGNIGDGGAGHGLSIRSAVLSGNTSPITLSGSNSYSGDTIVTSGSLNIGGRFALAGSTLDTSGAGSFALTAAGTNTYVLGGLKGSKAFAMGANSLEVGGNGQSTTYSGILSGSGSFSKVGSGVLTLGGSNSYSGPTSVDAGGLKLNGSIAGGLNVAAVAALSGTGTVGGNATIAGTHSPGNSPGIQTFNGNLTYEAGSLVNWELIANTTGTAGVNYDQIVVPTGNLTFSGSTTLALSFNGAGSTVDWSNAFWNVNRSWMVYDLSGGSTSNPSNLIVGGSLLDAQGDALSPTARGSFTTSLAGQDVMLNFVAVPEPSTWCLALTGLAAGGYSMIRRRMRA
jgi:autotransporter-associated beta strand protein